MRNRISDSRAQNTEPFLWGAGKGKMEKVIPEPYAHYDATAFTEARTLENGSSYMVTVYRNVVRP